MTRHGSPNDPFSGSWPRATHGSFADREIERAGGARDERDPGGLLTVAGECADGTVIGSAGPKTFAEHIVPTVVAAASAASRPAPRVVANVVAAVTDEVEAMHEFLVERLRAYGEFPSFKAMLEREGVDSQADIALIGDEARVTALIDAYRAAGVTDLVVAEMGITDDEIERTRACLAALAREKPEEF